MTIITKRVRRPPLHPTVRKDGKAPFNDIDLGVFEEDGDQRLDKKDAKFKDSLLGTRIGNLSPIDEEMGRSDVSEAGLRSDKTAKSERDEKESKEEANEEKREDEYPTALNSSDKFKMRSDVDDSPEHQQKSSEEEEEECPSSDDASPSTPQGGTIFHKAALKLKEKYQTTKKSTGSILEPMVKAEIDNPPTVKRTERAPTPLPGDPVSNTEQLQQHHQQSQEEKLVMSEMERSIHNSTPCSTEATTSTRADGHRRNVWNESGWPSPLKYPPSEIKMRNCDSAGSPTPFERDLASSLVSPHKTEGHISSEILKLSSGREERLAILQTIREKRQQLSLMALKLESRDEYSHAVGAIEEVCSTTLQSSPVRTTDAMSAKKEFKLFSVDPPAASEVEDPRMTRLLALRAKRQSMISSQHAVRQFNLFSSFALNESNESGDTAQEPAEELPDNENETSQQVSSEINQEKECQVSQEEEEEEEEEDKEVPESDPGDVAVDKQEIESTAVDKEESESIPVENLKQDQAEMDDKAPLNSTIIEEDAVEDAPEDVPEDERLGDESTVTKTATPEDPAPQTIEAKEDVEGESNIHDDSSFVMTNSLLSMHSAPKEIINLDDHEGHHKHEEDLGSLTDSTDDLEIIDVASLGTSVCAVPSEERDDIIILESEADALSEVVPPSTAHQSGHLEPPGHAGSPHHGVIRITPSLERMISETNHHHMDPEAAYLYRRSDPPTLSDSEESKRGRNMVESPYDEAGAKPTVSGKSDESVIDLIRLEDELEAKQEGKKAISTIIVDSNRVPADSATEPLSPKVLQSQTSEVHDSPFENIRRRLVRLDIKDFRHVVMEDVKKPDLSVVNKSGDPGYQQEKVHHVDEQKTKTGSLEKTATKTDRTVSETSSANDSPGGMKSKEGEAPRPQPSPTVAKSQDEKRMSTHKPSKKVDLFSVEHKDHRLPLVLGTGDKPSDKNPEEILDELVREDSFAESSARKPNLSSTVESILGKSDDSSFRSGNRPPNMHVRFSDYDVGLQTDPTESYVDHHNNMDQDDGTFDSMKSLETDDSSAETLYESTTVPMLVRMLDRGCAWLEENPTCGVDTRPSLLRESKVRPTNPSIQRNKRRIGRRKKNANQNRTSLPSTLPKPSPKNKRVASAAAPIAGALVPQTEKKSVLNSEGSKPNLALKKTAIPFKPNRPTNERKVKKGPKSRKKSKNLFELPLFKNGTSGEYKLSRGFFNKPSESSSLETSTDSSSYENPIGANEIEDSLGEDDSLNKFRALVAEVRHYLCRQSIIHQLPITRIYTHFFVLQNQKGPPSPEKGPMVSETRKFNFESRGLDPTDISKPKRKGPQTQSDRMQELPPTPTHGSEAIDAETTISFQDKLQQRLTRVRDTAPMLMDGNTESIESVDLYNLPKRHEGRDPDESIGGNILKTTPGRKDPPESGKRKSSRSPSHSSSLRKNSMDTTKNGVPRYTADKTNQEKRQERNLHANTAVDRSETERLAALALAEKLRKRATDLKEKRRHRGGQHSSEAPRPPLEVSINA